MNFQRKHIIKLFISYLTGSPHLSLFFHNRKKSIKNYTKSSCHLLLSHYPFILVHTTCYTSCTSEIKSKERILISTTQTFTSGTLLKCSFSNLKSCFLFGPENRFIFHYFLIQQAQKAPIGIVLCLESSHSTCKLTFFWFTSVNERLVHAY
jgi:hypothetical protein